VRCFVCGARDEACDIDFDEGPKLPDWIGGLERRGISVMRDELRDETAAVLRYCTKEGGIVYNGRQGGQA